MGVAFAFSMYLETQATQQFVATTQARFVAEGGVSFARALLDEDRLGSRTDDLTETWATAAQGSDVDVDGDRILDARWRLLTDANRRTIGRYALSIQDESGKADLNAGQADPSPLTLGAVNLTVLLEQAGIVSAHAVAQAIERYRDGEDQRPGVGGVDDDADGAIDEADEYQPMALRGDDRRLDSLEDLAAIADLNAQDIRRLSRLATVYSWDLNVGVTGTARVNVNTATAEELLSVLFDAGVRDPWQAAVNIADYVDPDVEMSRLAKSSQLALMSDEGPVGNWRWSNTLEGHYASQQSEGQPLSWIVPVPTGTFRLFARGLAGMKVGDVTVAGQLKPSVDDGELLGTFTLSSSLTVEVANHEPVGTPCGFRGLELVSEASEGGLVVGGIEAVRFNELMIEPKIEFGVSSAVFDPQGSDWGCPVGAETCINSGVGQGRWLWTSTLLAPGRYYVRVFGQAAGQTVGEVRIDGNSDLLVHGQSHPSTILVGSDGKITLTIGKTKPEETYYLKGITLSVQPDAEYVELINLSDRDVDVSGWTIEGELTGGRQARLPSGSLIRAHSLLVAAVDLDDRQVALANNGIDARSAWGMSGDVNAVQLEFPGGAPSPDDDWLKVALPGGGQTRLLLRSGERTVDEVEYPLPPPTTAAFQSLEKGDPGVRVDRDSDGLDDEWYPSLKLYTPGLTNDNNGLRELRGLAVIVHDPAKEVTVPNRPLAGVGELAGLPSEQAWKPFASADLAKVVDRLTVEGLHLEAEGRLVAGQDAWKEKGEGYYEYNSTTQPAISGTWRWTDIPDGQYRLSLYGWSGEQMSVRWERRDGAFTDWSPPLSSDAQGRVVIGQVAIGESQRGSDLQTPEAGTPPHTLTLELRCASQHGICHLDHIRLDPQLIRLGPINVNTAPREVLLALPEMTEALALRIIAGRPYGDTGKKGRGIGDLLIEDVLGTDETSKLAVFRRLAHLFTTRSNVFEIQSIGQSMEEDRVGATQRILTVVQR